MRRPLVKNITSYSALQALQYVAPLLTIPVLTRSLGTTAFGTYAVALTAAMLTQLVVDFGITQTSTQQVAAASPEQIQLKSIFWEIIACKLITSILPLAAAFIISTTAPKPISTAILVAMSMAALAQIMLPTWLLEGTQDFSHLAMATGAARGMQVIMTITLIRTPEDLLLAVTFETAVPLLAALLLAPKLRTYWKPVSTVTWSQVISRLGHARYIFISNVAVSLYTASATLILALFTSQDKVAAYALADRAITATKAVLRPLSAAYYPHMARLASSDRDLFWIERRRSLPIFAAIGVISSAIIWFGADVMITVLAGPSFENAVSLLRIMAPIPFLVSLSNFFGMQTLLALGYIRTFGGILTACASAGLLCALVLSAKLEATGMAIAVLLTEVAVTVAMYLTLRACTLSRIRSHG